MIRRVIAIIVLLPIGFAAGYFPVRRPPPRTPAHSFFDTRHLSRAELHATTFAGAAESIRGQSGCGLAANWPGAAPLGVPDATFDPDLSFHDVTLNQFLGRLNRALAGTGSNGRSIDAGRPMVNFTADDGFVLVEWCQSHPADFGVDDEARRPHVGTCVYNIEKLILSDGPWEKLALPPSEFPARGPFTMAQRRELLQNTLSQLVDTENWREIGGSIGSQKILGGQIMITQTAPNQRAIYEIIKTLREAK